MNIHELVATSEEEGWEFILRYIQPSDLDDAALAEALIDAREAFFSLLSLVEGIDPADMESDEIDELDFG